MSSTTCAVVVRIDGSVERGDRPVSLSELKAALGDVSLAAYTIHAPCPPSVSLTMLVNDDSWAVIAPLNRAATAVCHGDASPVLGDVAITGDDPLAAEHVAAIVATAEAYAT